MDRFWIMREGQRLGPFDEEEILRSYESGALHAHDRLVAEGGGPGASIGEVFGELRRDILTSPDLILEPPEAFARAPASPYAPPAARLADPVDDPDGPPAYAGFWVRFAASVLDNALIGLAATLLGFLIGFAAAVAGSGETVIAWLGGIAGLAVGWIYFAGTESGPHLASPGKRALRLRVLSADGLQRISFARATGRWAGRYLSMLLLFAGYLMQPFTARRQALHDLLSGTVVIAIGPTRGWLVGVAIVLSVAAIVLGFVLGAMSAAPVRP